MAAPPGSIGCGSGKSRQSRPAAGQPAAAAAGRQQQQKWGVTERSGALALG